MSKANPAPRLFAMLLMLPLTAVAGGVMDLIVSIKAGDHDALRALLAQPGLATARDGDGATALHWAAHRDDGTAARLLLQAGADVNAANDYGVTPLWLACTNRSHGMTEILLQAGADPDAVLNTGETVLMNCVRTGATGAVETLLAAGADLNAAESLKGQTALMWAAAGARPGMVQLLMKHGAKVSAASFSGFTPLLFAARSGDLESARHLLEGGADPNETSVDQGNALVIASAGGHEELARHLLAAGTRPDSADKHGITPLHHAAGKGLSILSGVLYDGVYRVRPVNMPGLAKALLEAGAGVDAQITRSRELGPDGTPFGMAGATPFLLAAASSDVELMHLLRSFGADPGVPTRDGVTPLMAAAHGACTGTCAYQGGNVGDPAAIDAAYKAVRAVLGMGVDVNAVIQSGRAAGQTAMHMAAFTGASPIVQLLADHGARVDVRAANDETPWTMASGISPLSEFTGLYGSHVGTADLLLKLGASTGYDFSGATLTN